jgi:hypothetical protein
MTLGENPPHRISGAFIQMSTIRWALESKGKVFTMRRGQTDSDVGRDPMKVTQTDCTALQESEPAALV